MGGNSSRDMSTTDIMNEFTTSVVTNIMNEKKVTIGVDQKMNFSCSKEVYDKAIEMCTKAEIAKEDTKKTIMAAYVAAGKEPSTALIQSLDKDPIACQACTVENIDQSSLISISMNDVNDNSIAAKIQTDLLSKLDAAKTTLQNEGFSKNDVLDASMTTIRNKINSDITTNIINSALTSFVVNQDITTDNVSAKNVAQTSVVNFVSASIVENVVNGDATVKAAVENIMTKENTQKSIASNTTDMVGSVANNLISTVGGVANNAINTLGDIVGGVGVVYMIIFLLIGYAVYKIFFSGGGEGGNQAMQMAMMAAQGQLGGPMSGPPGAPPSGMAGPTGPPPSGPPGAPPSAMSGPMGPPPPESTSGPQYGPQPAPVPESSAKPISSHNYVSDKLDDMISGIKAPSQLSGMMNNLKNVKLSSYMPNMANMANMSKYKSAFSGLKNVADMFSKK